jgi:hypothetical protein
MEVLAGFFGYEELPADPNKPSAHSSDLRIGERNTDPKTCRVTARKLTGAASYFNGLDVAMGIRSERPKRKRSVYAIPLSNPLINRINASAIVFVRVEIDSPVSSGKAVVPV